MNIALETPTELLQAVQPLADFDWVLAHLVMEDASYALWYKESKRLKVLDNSVNELLEPMNPQEMIHAANYVDPDYLVAPDFLGDKEKTLHALDEAVGVFGQDVTLPVLQGETLEECQECAKAIKAWGFRRISIPYDILSDRRDSSLDQMGKNRNTLIANLGINFSWIHLLGFTTPKELLPYKEKLNILSQDTGKPIMWGLRKELMGIGAHYLYARPQGDPTLSKMVQTVSSQTDLWAVYWNLAEYRRIANDVGGSLRPGI